MIRAVLFDFDGTLTAPGAIDFQAIRLRLCCPSDQPILEYIDRLDPQDQHRALDILEAMELEAARRSRPNTGALELLLWLKHIRIPFGLLTRNGPNSVYLTLTTFKEISARDFGVIVTRAEAPPKPDPAGVLLAAARLSVDPREILFVGDYRFDVIAGHRAGSLTAFLSNGKPLSWIPGDPEPHYTIHRLLELKSIIRPRPD
ncbi:MAG: HAD family hydrolase [Deltaproteobacteria bacterium]|nr:HAD family hydrolase [Deltaproteobacteria bacterium]